MEYLLRGLKTEVIIFSGVATNVCVESTIRDAFFRDFGPIIIEDCVVAYTQQAHEASLRNLRFFGSAIRRS
jgi:ureidoacrylate peracid hydrolase